MRHFPEISDQTTSLASFDPSIDSFTRAIVNRKVQSLIDRSGFQYQDRDDLKQEILARVIKSLESFDEGVGHLYPYITAVVNRHISTILRDRKTAKRSSGTLASLNIDVKSEDAGSTELLQTISNREVDRRLGRERTLSEEQLNDLKSDMANVIARLPKQLQEFLELRKTLSLNEIAGHLNVSRTTLVNWTEEIRSHFEAASLEKYFLK